MAHSTKVGEYAQPSFLDIRARLTSAGVLRRSAIAIAGALLLGLVLSYVALLQSGNAGPKQTDFVAYYAGARMVDLGHAGMLYDLPALGALESSVVRPLHVRNGVLPFIYPPYVAALLAPFGGLPYALSYILWLILNIAILVLFIVGSHRYLSLRGEPAVLLWIASIAFVPIFIALAQGQTSILVLVLMGACFLAARKNSDALAGVLLACAAIKPPYVVPIAIVFLMRGRWKVIGTFLVSSILLLVFPIALFGRSGPGDYLNLLRIATGWRHEFGYEPPLNHSLAGLAQLSLSGFTATAVTGILSALVLIVVGWSARRAPNIEIPFALGTIAALCISPHVLAHDLSLLLLPVVIAVHHRSTRTRSLACLLSIGYVSLLIGFRLAFIVPVQASVLVMLALGGWLVWAHGQSLEVPGIAPAGRVHNHTRFRSLVVED